MRPVHLEISRIRGIDRLSLPVRDLTTLIGPNNAGKSTVLDAVRLFYGDLVWNDSRDLPWHLPEYSEDVPGASYVEITYGLEPSEAFQLDFHADGDRLRLRRYFTDAGEVRIGGLSHTAGDIYSLPEGALWSRGDHGEIYGEHGETAIFARARPLVGSCVYVPALLDLADRTRTAESSVLRNLMQRALDDATASTAIHQVSVGLAQLRAVLAHEDGPAHQLERRLSEALTAWGLDVNIGVTDLTPEIILDQMLRLRVVEDGHHADLSTQGTGVQRVALAALIQAAAELSDTDAGFTWVLFEEPETHLHPAHVGRLGDELARLARTGRTSVMTTTHSESLLAAQGGLDSVVRLRQGHAVAPSEARLRTAAEAVRHRSAYTSYARDRFTGTPRLATRAQTEARMLGDLDAWRAAAFFADRVIVVEGFSDCALFDWLERRGLLAPLGGNVGVLDANGKYELHRAVTTLSLFGIPHALVWDEDAALVAPNETAKHAMRARQDEAAWQAIRAAANDVHDPPPSTVGGIRLAGTIESWLGVPQEKDNSWKTANLTTALDDAFNDPSSPVRERITALVTLLAGLFDGKPLAAHRQAPCFQDCLIAPPFPPATVDFTNLPTSSGNSP